MIDLGEEMNLSSQEIDNSLKRMEAHRKNFVTFPIDINLSHKLICVT